MGLLIFYVLNLSTLDRSGCNRLLRSAPAVIDPRRSVSVRSYPSPKVRGRDRERQAETGQGQRLRGATPAARSSCYAGARGPRSYSTFKVRRGGREKIPLILRKEQQLHFAGAAMKRYPTSKVKRNPSKTVGVVRGHQTTNTL